MQAEVSQESSESSYKKRGTKTANISSQNLSFKDLDKFLEV